MSFIQGEQIYRLIKLFKEREVQFYHACQYKDFKTYLQLSGVPSRQLMQASGLPYTPFDTDDVDQKNGVWDKVFGNLSDFGWSFAQGRRNENTAPTPNPYGPVLLVFNPEAFAEIIDIAICLRSAGADNFNRDGESLGSVEEIDRIFKHNLDDAPNNYAKAYIKFSQALQQEFNNPQAMSPEVSCTVSNERISFRHLSKIIVDPYQINNQILIAKVRQLKQKFRLNGVVWERRYSQGRREVKQEFANLLIEKNITVDEVINDNQASQDLKDWASRIKKGGNKTITAYNRFSQYLRSGTILELFNDIDNL